MNYKIETIPRFEKDIKKLKKRYPNIKKDLLALIEELQSNKKVGTHLGENIYKVRLANSSIPTGKSGGFRVITYYHYENIIYLITIYSKTEQENILTNEIKKIIQDEFSNQEGIK